MRADSPAADSQCGKDERPRQLARLRLRLDGGALMTVAPISPSIPLPLAAAAGDASTRGAVRFNAKSCLHATTGVKVFCMVVRPKPSDGCARRSCRRLHPRQLKRKAVAGGGGAGCPIVGYGRAHICARAGSVEERRHWMPISPLSAFDDHRLASRRHPLPVPRLSWQNARVNNRDHNRRGEATQ